MRARAESRIRGIVFLLVISLVSCEPVDTEARRAIAIGDYTRARALLEESIARSPEDPDLRQLALEVYERTRDWEAVIATTQVLSHLRPTSSAPLAAMHAQAQLGRAAEAAAGLAEWPEDAVEETLATELLSRAPVGDAEIDQEDAGAVVQWFADASPDVYLEAALTIGLPQYRATQVLVVDPRRLSVRDYLAAELAARHFSELQALSTDLAAIVRGHVEQILAALPEPEFPASLGSGLMADLGVRGYWTDMERYFLAMGDLEAALATDDRGLNRAANAYEKAEDSRRVRRRYTGESEQPSPGMSRMVRILAGAEDSSRLEAVCHLLRSEYPSWYGAWAPAECEQHR